MNKVSFFSMILGTISTIIGILPQLFAFPYSNGPNSGPAGIWELILVLSYEGRAWFLLLGIALLIYSGLTVFKQQNING